MNKAKNIVVIFLLLIIYAACNPVNKKLINKKWHVFAVQVSQNKDDAADGNIIYFNKSRSIETYWSFTENGNYTIVENGKVAGGKWEMLDKTSLILTELPDNKIREVEIKDIHSDELILKYANQSYNNFLFTTLYFRNNLDKWPTDAEIKELNAANNFLNPVN